MTKLLTHKLANLRGEHDELWRRVGAIKDWQFAVNEKYKQLDARLKYIEDTLLNLCSEDDAAPTIFDGVGLLHEAVIDHGKRLAEIERCIEWDYHFNLLNKE